MTNHLNPLSFQVICRTLDGGGHGRGRGKTAMEPISTTPITSQADSNEINETLHFLISEGGFKPNFDIIFF